MHIHRNFPEWRNHALKFEIYPFCAYFTASLIALRIAISNTPCLIGKQPGSIFLVYLKYRQRGIKQAVKYSPLIPVS